MKSVRGIFLGGIVWAIFGSNGFGDDAEIVKALESKGAKAALTKGIVTGLTVPNCSKWAPAEIQQIGQLSHLKSLSIDVGLTDSGLATLTGLSELEQLSTNGAQISDAGVKPLARLKKLRGLKFFHPGKSFTGSGLAELASLPNLESVTVAGSLAFGDEGMAAVGKLTQLKQFRSWHAGQTGEGIKKLKDLKNLKSLHYGQRLAYKPPACLDDDTLAVIAEMKSLEWLELDEARLQFAALARLKQLPRLKSLTLGGIDMAEADVERLRKEMPGVEIKWTKPSDIFMKRIRALFGEK